MICEKIQLCLTLDQFYDGYCLQLCLGYTYVSTAAEPAGGSLVAQKAFCELDQRPDRRIECKKYTGANIGKNCHQHEAGFNFKMEYELDFSVQKPISSPDFGVLHNTIDTF